MPEATIGSRESLWRELDKCVLLCTNCHNELHDGLIEVLDDWRHEPDSS